MKKTLLISTAVLLSIASMAQTKVSSNQAAKATTGVEANRNSSRVEGSGSATATTAVAQGELNKASGKTNAEIQKNKKRIKTKKEQTGQQVTQTRDEAKAIAEKDAAVSTSANASTSVKAGNENNNVSNNSSANASATVATAPVKNNVVVIAHEGNDAVNAKAQAVVATGGEAKTNINNTTIRSEKKIKATSATTSNAGTTQVQAAQPKPVLIKTTTQVKTNAGIKLR